MQRKFLGNLFFLIFLNLLIKPFWILGVDRAVQNAVGQEAYGEYFALLNFSFLLNIFLDLGITNYNNRNIARHQFLFNKYLYKLLGIKGVLAVLYFALSAFFAVLVGYSQQQWQLLFLLMLNQFLVSLILFLRSNFSALFRFKTDSIISVLDRGLLILFCGFLLLYQEGSYLNIKNFVLAQTAAYGVVAIGALLMLIRIKDDLKTKFRWTYGWVIFKQSLPFALLVLLMAIYTRTDAVMLERMLGDQGKRFAGLYAQSYRLMEALNMIAFLFSTLLLPMFSRMLKAKEDVSNLVNSSSKIMVLFSGSAFVVLTVFHHEVMRWMYVDAMAESVSLLPYLIFCILPISGTYIYGTLLTANGSLKALNFMATFGVFLNIGLNLILIPKYQALGAVWATIFTQSLTFLIQFYLSKRLVNKLNLALSVKVILFLGFNFSFGHWVYLNSTPIMAFSLISICLCVSAFVLKLVDIKSIKEILRSKA